MTDILIAELSLPAYAELSDADAAAALNTAIAGTYGHLDLDWLDSLLIGYDVWPTLRAAAAGTVPTSVSTEADAAAVKAARMIVETVDSGRKHPYIDTSLGQFAGGLTALMACGVVSAEVAALVAAKIRLSRAGQLGLGAVTEVQVCEARIILADLEARR